MATVAQPTSMNEPNKRDPYNNNSYGTLVDSDYLMVELPVLDVTDFNERIIRGYEEGYGEKELPADLSMARSLIPAGTATLRDFSYVAPEIPEFVAENCTGCMDCVTECPDTAILGKVLSEPKLEEKLKTQIDNEEDRAMFLRQWSKPRKYYEGPKKKRQGGGAVRHYYRPQQV
jgi:ferredoxin